MEAYRRNISNKPFQKALVILEKHSHSNDSWRFRVASEEGEC